MRGAVLTKVIVLAAGAYNVLTHRRLRSVCTKPAGCSQHTYADLIREGGRIAAECGRRGDMLLSCCAMHFVRISNVGFGVVRCWCAEEGAR